MPVSMQPIWISAPGEERNFSSAVFPVPPARREHLAREHADEEVGAAAVQVMVVLEEAIGNPRPVVDELRTKAAAHAVHVSAESALDLARVELAHPARHRHAHERDADPGVLTTGQEVLEGAGGAAVEPIVAQPLPRLAEPEQRRGVGSHALRWLGP